MAWRREWEEGGEPRRGGPGWRAVLAQTPVSSAIFLGAIGATLLEMLHFGAGLPVSPARWLGLRLGNAPFVFPFFTYVLPHDAGQIFHLLINMLVLWFLGRELEVRLGRGRYLTLFFGAALTGAVAHLVVSAARGNPAALIGASGGLYGLIFFVARESPDRPFYVFLFRVPAKVLAIVLVVISLHPLLLGGLDDGVAHLCHLGGAAFGFAWFRWRFDALSWAGALRDDWRSRRAAAHDEDERAADAEMDRLLAKIHEQGMPSLTERERRFLQRRSEELKGGRR